MYINIKQSYIVQNFKLHLIIKEIIRIFRITLYLVVSLTVCNTALPIAESDSSKNSSWCATKSACAPSAQNRDFLYCENFIHRRLKINHFHLGSFPRCFIVYFRRSIYYPLFGRNIFKIIARFFSWFLRVIISRRVICS